MPDGYLSTVKPSDYITHPEEEIINLSVSGFFLHSCCKYFLIV